MVTGPSIAPTDWSELYRLASARLGSTTGYYNHNIRIELKTGPVNVRIPIKEAEVMDLRLWREPDVLTAIAPYVDCVPELLYAHDSGAFQVHQFIAGDLLNESAPRRTPTPVHVLSDVVNLFAQLCTVPRECLPPSTGWSAGENTARVARTLSDFTQGIYDTFQHEYRPLYRELRFPADPLAGVRYSWGKLRRRPLRLVHADVHRKNIILVGDRCTFLDWELALWGDAVYDFAVHLHKMEYLPAEQSAITARWAAQLPADCIAGWEADLDRYLAHEQVKSAIVDTVRYAQAFARRDFKDPPNELAEKLTTKINNAWTRWGIKDRLTQRDIGSLLRKYEIPEYEIRAGTAEDLA